MKKNIAYTTALFLYAIAVLSAPTASDLKSFPIPSGETLSYRIIEKNPDKKTAIAQKVISSEHSFAPATLANGTKVVQHTCRETRSDGVVQNWVFNYSFNSPIFKALNYSLQKTSSKGDIYYKEESEFGDPFNKLPADVVHPISLTFLIAGIDFASKPVLSLHTWNNEGEPSKVVITVVGVERITVPYKTADTWKVYVKVDLENMKKSMGMTGRFIAAIVPDYYLWYDKAAPHRPLKIQTVFSSAAMGKSEYIQELTRVSKN